MNNENETTIVKFTNITEFDFNGESGARYGGRDYFIPAGGSLLVPQYLGEHLAKHLAHKIIINQNGNSISDLPLWSEDLIKEYTDRMITFVGVDVPEQKKSEADILAEKVANLNKSISSEGDETEEGDIIATTLNPEGQTEYANKQEVIAKLEEKGIKYDARQNKSQLEKLLISK